MPPSLIFTIGLILGILLMSSFVILVLLVFLIQDTINMVRFE